MDFRFSQEDEAFRQEVRAFLAQELPATWTGHGGIDHENDDEKWEFAVAFQKRLGKRGWIAPAWPKQYGGAGMTIMQQVVYNEEMAYRGAPTFSGPGVGMVGPTLIVHGTDEQRTRHLPGIASVDVIWCQGYSEPGAGSDLASLQTRAVRDGDDYVINGQKIWTSVAQRAGWMFMLARTSVDTPKHRGISAFLLDMKSPGVSVRPLTDILSRSGFINEVFFDNVRVPKENLVGEENRGWYVGVTLLDFERSNIAGAAGAKRELEEFVQYCKDTRTPDGHALIDRPSVRYALADQAIAIAVGRSICYRVASIQARGQIPNMEASASSLYFRDLNRKFVNERLRILGMYGMLRPENQRWVLLEGEVGLAYFGHCPVAGGSAEVQRNIIATRGLGLPRA